MVGMVDALAGARLEWIVARDGGSIGRNERVEDGLALVGLPQVGGEGRAVDGNIDAVGGGVGGDGDAVSGGGFEHGG